MNLKKMFENNYKGEKNMKKKQNKKHTRTDMCYTET